MIVDNFGRYGRSVAALQFVHACLIPSIALAVHVHSAANLAEVTWSAMSSATLWSNTKNNNPSTNPFYTSPPRP